MLFRSDLLRERAADGGQAEERGRADVVHDLEQRAELRCVWLRAREELLVVREVVAAVVGDEALRAIGSALGIRAPTRERAERTLESTSQNIFFACSCVRPWSSK